MGIGASAIILSAGKGNRMGLPANNNKCAAAINGTSAVRHTAVSLLELGIERLIIVVGHAERSVRGALEGLTKNAITFVKNPYYDFHGCNYSLACGMLDEAMNNAQRLLIAEGDSLLHPESIRIISDTDALAASLIRPASYIDYFRSVMAIGSNNNIVRYYYDQEHTGTAPVIAENEAILGESMQLWSFSGKALRELRMLAQKYKQEADSSRSPMPESGVYSINTLKMPITPVISNYPDQWINLNMPEDLKKASEQKWLRK